MKTTLLSLALAFGAAAPTLAATIPMETGGLVRDSTDQQAPIAVASACVSNNTNFRIVFNANWGIDGERWSRLVLNPGDVGLYRLVMDAVRPDTSLTLKFPADPTSGAVADQAIPATWGTVRENDCAKLPSFNFVLQTTDGGANQFALVAATPAN